MVETDFLARTRDGYDRTAQAYAQRFHDHLADKPVDLAVLSAFSGLVTTGPVVDIGCGTGATTAILYAAGLDIVGIDLSPNMIEQARRLNPGIDFAVGSMTALPLGDSSVRGVCAWYSVIHIPDAQLPAVFTEFHRALAPGGVVLLAFQVGEQPRHLSEAFGETIDLTFHRRHPDAVAALLAEAGLPVFVKLVREPDDDGVESTPQGYLIARKPF